MGFPWQPFSKKKSSRRNSSDQKNTGVNAWKTQMKDDLSEMGRDGDYIDIKCGEPRKISVGVGEEREENLTSTYRLNKENEKECPFESRLTQIFPVFGMENQKMNENELSVSSNYDRPKGYRNNEIGSLEKEKRNNHIYPKTSSVDKLRNPNFDNVSDALTSKIDKDNRLIIW